MRTFVLLAALGAAATAAPAPLRAQAVARMQSLTAHAARATFAGATFATEPRAPWRADDPADSLYRLARGALNGRDYLRAAELFRAIYDRFPRSEYASEALYWQAFALYRAGGPDNLRAALRSLEEQSARFPAADRSDDAAALATRIRGLLASAGDASAQRQIERQVERQAGGGARGDCDDEEMSVQLAAINALQQMDAERALPVLQRVLARRDECSAKLREQALYIVSQQAPRQRDDILLDVTRSDPSTRVRELAVYYLSQSDSDRAVQALDDVLRRADDAQLQEKALYALSQMRAPAAHAILRAELDRPEASERLRDLAIYYLGQSHTAQDVAFLRATYDRLTNAKLKNKIQYTLSQIGGDDNLEWMLDAATDTAQAPEVRKSALYFATQMDRTGAALVAAWDRMRGREMRDQLLYFLSQRREREALDRIIAVAKSDPDRELRKKAIYFLSQSKDPRAVQALAEIVEQQ